MLHLARMGEVRGLRSLAEVLCGFDVDCCAVCYDGARVYGLPRAVDAINSRINLADGTRQSPTYETRLLKYAKRGFSVAVPVCATLFMSDGWMDGERGTCRVSDAVKSIQISSNCLLERHWAWLDCWCSSIQLRNMASTSRNITVPQ